MFKSTFSVAIILLYLTAIALTSPPAYEVYRLPKTLRPTHYKLEILTHLGDDEGFKFSGKVWIKIICDISTSNITLHMKNLTISSENIKLKEVIENSVAENIIETEQPIIDEQNEYLIIPTKSKLEEEKEYELYVPFEAELMDGLLGYYRSSYLDMKTQKNVWLSVTQFEPTYARRAFPCFDEPEFKAKFEIILGHHKSLNALSNMPTKSCTPIEGKPNWVWDRFDETVPMSTYLVAYSINDFEYRESKSETNEKISFKIWARRDAIDQVDYAVQIGPKVLKFYEKYFDIDFPLPKMDMIAIPDFSAGAMENWGLITYRETALLYHPNISSATSQHRVASVISHELAHQWFGNLVTMKWWTDLWLNEGFATYIASLGVHYLHPEWNSLSEEFAEQTHHVFAFDSLKSSHPVSVPIGNPSEISQIFDAISYQKGASIIRMMHYFLGEESFRNGVSNYLKLNEYDNAEQDDLWDCLTHEAHVRGTLPESVTVKEIMDTWTLQTGYPVVNVKRDYDESTMKITQKRFFSEKVSESETMENCWEIPLSYTTEDSLNFNNTQPKEWLHCNQKVQVPLTLSNITDDEHWIIFNIQYSGLYRVQYDEKNWELLIKHLNSPDCTDIHTLNRAQLIDDALDMAWNGDADYSIALRVVQYLKYEKEYIPWHAALTNLNHVNVLLKRTGDYGAFIDYIKKILEPIYETMGGLNVERKPTDHLDNVKHKVLISTWACRFNVGDCVDRVKGLYKEWMEMKNPDENNPIPSDLRSVVYCNAVRAGDDTEWNFLWERYNKSNVGAEKQIILSSLGCTREIWLLKRYLEWTITSNSGIRKQDISIAFSAVARNDVGFFLAVNFFYGEFEAIHNYLRPDLSRIGRLIRPLANSMMTVEEYEKLAHFVMEHSKFFEKSSNTVKQSLEKIEINIQWFNKNYHKLSKLLKNVS